MKGFEFLEGIPKYQKILLIVIVIAALGTGIYYLLFKKQLEKKEALEATIQALEEKIQKSLKIQAQLPEFQTEVERLEKKLELAKQILPNEKEMPQLLTNIQSLATQSGLTVLKFEPQNMLEEDFYQEMPILIEVRGGYHQLGAFCDKVGRLSRIVNITKLKLTPFSSKESSDTIKASCIATTFLFLETSLEEESEESLEGKKEESKKESQNNKPEKT